MKLSVSRFGGSEVQIHAVHTEPHVLTEDVTETERTKRFQKGCRQLCSGSGYG